MLGDFNIFDPTDATMQALLARGFVVPAPLIDQRTNLGRDRSYDQIAFHDDDARLEFTGNAGSIPFFDAVFTDGDVPMCATGTGSLMNVHGTGGPVRSVDDLRTGDDRWEELLFFAALEAGFYVARRGFIALSIEVTDDDVDAFLAFAAGWAAGVRDLR